MSAGLIAKPTWERMTWERRPWERKPWERWRPRRSCND